MAAALLDGPADPPGSAGPLRSTGAVAGVAVRHSSLASDILCTSESRWLSEASTNQPGGVGLRMQSLGCKSLLYFAHAVRKSPVENRDQISSMQHSIGYTHLF